MRRCSYPDNQAHIDELERLIKKQTKDIRQFQDDVQTIDEIESLANEQAIIGK